MSSSSRAGFRFRDRRRSLGASRLRVEHHMKFFNCTDSFSQDKTDTLSPSCAVKTPMHTMPDCVTESTVDLIREKSPG